MKDSELRPFQRRFLKAALAPFIDTAALSLPRGNGKSALAGHILEKCLSPGDDLHVAGSEYLLCAASIEQARIVFRFIRAALEPTGEYRFIDSVTRLGITHQPTNTRLRVLSSNGRTAFGIVGCPVLVADEGGSWETVGGGLMNDAIQTALGKPNSPMRVIYVGTLAPATGGWWHELIEGGSRGSVHVQALQGDLATWDSWPTIRKANPLVEVSADFRRKLLSERDAARADSRLKARFLSYRLNLPSADESEMLLTVSDWQRMAARDVPERQGRPIVAVDLGGGRAWSAACAVWQSGRVEALALAPGVPSIQDQERRDRVPAGSYAALVDRGLLLVAEGLRVQPASQLWAGILARWGMPVNIICDRFRLGELQDAVKGGCTIEPRVTRWSDSSADVRALRKLVKDGPLSVAEDSRPVLAESLKAALVKQDDAGNTRMVKRGSNNEARDDVAAALALAGGAFERAASSKPTGPRYAVVA